MQFQCEDEKKNVGLLVKLAISKMSKICFGFIIH